jgi:DNA-binding transcriptional regulator GbsR (MarR family)
MQLDEAKEKFIQAWGTLGSNWGINRTMAQVHALLLVSAAPLSTEDNYGISLIYPAVMPT